MLCCIVGKSASGKDTVYSYLMKDRGLAFKRLITCTTRPIRPGEKDGVEYRFLSEEEFRKLDAEGHVLEKRTYHTQLGDWYYFTTDDTDITGDHFLVIATVDSCASYIDKWGNENILPIYIEASDHTLLTRYITREAEREEPHYDEVCRRFLADRIDFSEERLSTIGVAGRFSTENGSEKCAGEIAVWLKEKLEGSV
ncbi:MAG: guanylate kinase [Lachnospiraceae bacterium]|nr:guanylate kinase [Lachnospiraceae bacterium]